MARRWNLELGAVLLLSSLAACGRVPEQGIARGKDLFDTCVPCHGANGGGNQALGAPAIAGLPQWYIEAQLAGFQAGHRGYAPFDTVGIRMKTMSWSLDLEGDNASVAEYVASLSPVPQPTVLHGGDAAAGQTTWAVCTSCHGADARGNDVLHAPPLAGQADWYLAAQLRKFRVGWRGTADGDVWGGSMRPNAMALDDAAISNVIAYLHTLREGQ